MAQTIPFPTPADVKDLPLAVKWTLAFAAISDAKIQVQFIDNCATLFGSAEVLRHTQRNEAVLYGAAHLLALRLIDEGVIGGGGGGGGFNGPLSSVHLDGVGSKSFAVAAWTSDDLNDWLKRPTAFSPKLHAILDTFPPGMYVIGALEGLNEFTMLGSY